jgi:hypothetical protein
LLTAHRRTFRPRPVFRPKPHTGEPRYTEDEIEFMLEMDRFKRANRRPFPTWHEVLDVLKSLGYRKRTLDTKEIA